MKQFQRFAAVLLCVCVVFTSVMLCSEQQNTQVTYNIMSTMSGSSKLTKLASTSSSASEPYYSNQWYLENDGTFSPTTDSEISNPGTINFPGENSVPDTTYDFPTIQPGPGSNSMNNRVPGGRQEFNMPNGFMNRFSTSSVTQPGLFNRLTYQSKITAVADVDLDASEAWNVVGDSGRDVIVAIIDTGVDYTHEDLKDAIWTNDGEVAADGIDNDNNGYIDDVYGWDFYNNQPYEVESNSTEYDHGTHVAGVIAASSDNSIGISGIVPNSNIEVMSIKVLGGSDGSGTADAVISAIQYAEKMGASICNLSFGTSYDDSNLKAAIEASDMLFVCAAGNASNSMIGDNTDVSPTYPASYDLDNIISVANLTYNGALDSTSNYGQTSVDIAAPGSYIFSSVTNNSYEYMSGTSMAAPMVTAVAALVYSYREDISLSTVKDILLASAETNTSLTGKVATGGMLNAYNALTYDTAD